MLEHSLQDNPSDIYRDGESRIAGLIQNDSNFLQELDNEIANSNGNTLSSDIGVSFNEADLYFSIHKASIHIEGSANNDGIWEIHVTLQDTYDFTEIQSFMGNKNSEFSTHFSLGTIANDAATISQNLGAINSYNVRIEFDMER